MTWAKYGTEFFDQLAEYDLPADMDDVCQLTHTQVIHYLYSTEDLSGVFLKKNLRRIASSPNAEAAGKILASFGIWADRGNKYEIIHHAEVYRQSLGFQIGKREAERVRQQKHRSKGKGDTPDDPKGGVDVTEDVTRDVLTAQTDRQTDIQPALDNEVPFPEETFDTNTGEALEDNNPWKNVPVKSEPEKTNSGPDLMDQLRSFGSAS
ncbi:hypothetical protein [Glutamicibacter sp. M10]|uniref:hypothetical protein n=1 Tax=Glutamicibacter sp. M10 TaxID=3023076 RepID=UPI0021C7C315|nr:hypothetical protein [Glutamicibacter sp. M10]UXN30692.1 hypothetical protein N6V40_09455 [Glutamicibacter sp. M10]